MSTRTVAVIIGSLRKESFNRKIALALAAVAPSTLKFEIVEIGDLPLYNQDLEGGEITPPAAWSAFRKQVKAADAVLFVTPEYNRSIPGALKNYLRKLILRGRMFWMQKAFYTEFLRII